MNYILNKEFYTVPELAQLLRVHSITIRRHIQSGHLKATKLIPTDHARYRIFRGDLAEYLRKMGAEVEIDG